MSGWFDDAACKGSDPEQWAMADTHDRRAKGGRNSLKRIARARVICAGCPVINQCRAFYDTLDDKFMIAGGLTPQERGALRRKRTA